MNKIECVSTEKESERILTLSKCNAVKAFMMLAVIFQHSIDLWLMRGWLDFSPVYPSRFLSVLGEYLSTTHTYVFVFVSGYIFYYLKYETNKYNSYSKVICKKAKRLLIPYVFVVVLWILPFYIFFFGGDARLYFEHFVLATEPQQLWFLWMLFDIFIIFYPLSNTFKKIGFLPSLILCGAIFVGMYFLLSLIPVYNIFRLHSAREYLIFFYLGFALRQYNFKKLYKIPWVCYLALNLLLFGAYMFFYTRFAGGQTAVNIIKTGLLYAVKISSVFMIVVGFAHFKFEGLRHNKVYTFFEKNSFGMFLFHEQFIYVTITLLNGHVPNAVMVIVNFAVACLGSALITAALGHGKITRKLIGSK